MILNSVVHSRTISKIPSQKSSLVPTLSATQYCRANHRIGKLVLCVQNDGNFGVGGSTELTDYLTGEAVKSCEYPKGSNTMYLFMGSFWIGAVVDRDTLVSTGFFIWESGNEFIPESVGGGGMQKKSISSDDPLMREGAVSEEDYIAVYTDTGAGIGLYDYFHRPHIPLNIEVTQRSYGWSYAYAEDFILFDYSIRNVGSDRLEDAYMGIYVDGDVYFGEAASAEDFHDDICGFTRVLPIDYHGCQFMDTVNIAWIADNDGEPIGGVFGEQSVPHVTGTRIIRTPADSLDISFNWWNGNLDLHLDFGPREKSGVGLWEEEFRDFGTGGIGTPAGDVNRYYQMRNQEFDYDQIYTASIGENHPLWLPPDAGLAADFADGYDTRYLLSFGPFDIDPGESLPLSFAYIAGENFHTDPTNLRNLPEHPAQFERNLDFSDLGLNSSWAGKIYDNPGVDTDGDGYAGKVRICCLDGTDTSLYSINSVDSVSWFDPARCDVIPYEGDGVPDFRGASPPPAPWFWLTPVSSGIHVRINGRRSETAKDLFSGVPDFEGYRIYVGRDERESSYSVVSSYDKEDYLKLVATTYGFRLFDFPFSLDSLRCLYGSSCDDTLFHPLTYSEENPFRHPLFADSVFYFEKQDFNASEFGVRTPIVKTYPDQPYPSSLNPDSALASELTEDSYFKYFEYEFIIEHLLPTVPYWVNVTAFDFGSPMAGLAALETSVTIGAKVAYTGNSASDVEAENLKVYVYPNPYRADLDYRDAGYEGRTDADRPDCRLRVINFGNLPAKCTIRIYSLDGDLVRELDHDRDPGDPTASHDTWNMITRNTQMVASGLYYWTVEAEGGTVQIGKLVIVL